MKVPIGELETALKNAKINIATISRHPHVYVVWEGKHFVNKTKPFDGAKISIQKTQTCIVSENGDHSFLYLITRPVDGKAVFLSQSPLHRSHTVLTDKPVGDVWNPRNPIYIVPWEYKTDCSSILEQLFDSGDSFEQLIVGK